MRSHVVAVVSASGFLFASALAAPLIAQTASASGESAQVEGALKKGTELRSRGEFFEAINEFEVAEENASRTGNRVVQAEAMLQAAQTHQALFSKDTKQGDHIEKAIAKYQSAIEFGNPAQRVQAQNNLATLYLSKAASLPNQNDKKNAYANAIRYLRSVDTTRIPPAEKFIYDYNLGRAYDLSGQRSLAYPCYISALTANPNFTRAAEKAFENLRNSKGSPNIHESLSLADLLLKSDHSDMAAQEAILCLNDWGNDPKAVRLLTVLVRHYTMTSLNPTRFVKGRAGSPIPTFVSEIASFNPTRFVKGEWPTLEGLANRHSRLKPAIGEIRKAFDGDFPPAIQRPRAGSDPPFPAWLELEEQTAPGEKRFPELLNGIGDYYYESIGKDGKCRDPRRALARYSAAWSLDPSNSRSALFTAAVLRDSPQLDPEHKFYDQLVHGVFHEKGPYTTSKTEADWSNLLRMHYLLGSIFERKQVWGSEDTPRSAIYQWGHAIRAEDELRKLDRKYPPTPGLHQHLATAYKLTGHPEKAFEQFLSAAEEFVGVGDLASAKEALAAVGGLDTQRSHVQQGRLDRLAARITSSPGNLVQGDDRDPKVILDKAIKALGGEDKLKRAETATWKTKATITIGGNDNDLTIQSTIQGLDHYRAEIEGKFGDNEFKGYVVVNGKKGWRMFGEKMDMDEGALANEKRRTYLEVIPITLVALKGKGFKLEAASDEKIGDKPAAGIKITGPDGKDFTLYFDKESRLPVKLVAAVAGFGGGDEFTQEWIFKDYREFDGIKKATKVDSKRDGEDFMKLEITEFKVLDKVDPKTFAVPE
jgi:tetratricopeptide (TPR) repeat protein